MKFQDILDELEGYLLSININPETMQPELHVGIKNTWVYRETSKIKCDIINRSEIAMLISVSKKDNDLTIDDLFEYVKTIIKTNLEIEKQEEAFKRQLTDFQNLMEEQMSEFQIRIKEMKEKSFDNLENQKDNTQEETPNNIVVTDVDGDIVENDNLQAE